MPVNPKGIYTIPPGYTVLNGRFTKMGQQ
jgi:hypothetical protein